MCKSLIVFLMFFLTGCSGFLEKQQPVCEGITLLSGEETTVQIYAIRHQANQTQYKAGYPFNWQWVSKNNFSRTSCVK